MASAIGREILDWLDREHHNQAQLSVMAGVPESSLSKIISGKLQASPNNIRKLERTMGFPSGTLAALQSTDKLSTNGKGEQW